MICHESRDKINTCFLKERNSRRIILKVVVFGAPLGAFIYVLHVRRVSLDRVNCWGRGCREAEPGFSQTAAPLKPAS